MKLQIRQIELDDQPVLRALGVGADLTNKARRLWETLRRINPELRPNDVATAVRACAGHCEAFVELLAQRVARIKPHVAYRRRRARTRAVMKPGNGAHSQPVSH